MGDFLSILWLIVSFILGVLWSIVWFVLRDLLSTLLWLGIAVWLGFVLRYRSFGLGTLALLRYGRYAAAWGWRWVRGRPGSGSEAALRAPPPVTKIVKEYRQRVPLGYVSLSDQINMLIIALVMIMANV
jgi:hypothetical protein